MTSEVNAEAVERLVESMQAEVWSGRVPANELISVYEHACAARNHVAIPVTVEAIEAIREQMSSLAHQWDAIPINGCLALTFDIA